ncbi:MAG: type VI secretion protein IcmF/TssM N-terminal domain-containing protein [Planctomycetota bacterium]
MSDEESKEPPKRRWYRRILPRTVAGRTAVVTALVLIATLVTVWSIRAFGPDSVSLRHAMTFTRMAVELALTAAIPWAIYLGLSRWNQVIEGVYPDVDRAWQAGVEALEAQGVDIADHPLFLVLGSTDTDSERGLMDSLGSKLRLHAIPSEVGVNQPLQWYLTDDAIYLFCPGASALSGLMERWVNPESRTVISRPLPTRAVTSEGSTPSASTKTNVKQDVPAPSTAPPPADHFMGTLQSGALSSSSRPSPSAPVEMARSSTQPAPAASAAPVKSVTSAMRPMPSYQGTLALGQLPQLSEISKSNERADDDTTLGPLRSKRPSVQQTVSKLKAEGVEKEIAESTRSKQDPSHGTDRVALPAALDTSDQIPKLKYVCELLTRIRRPRCGINGTVTLIPFGLSKVGPLQLSAISQSVRGDVETIQETIGVRAPVTAVLVGLEQDKGFSELVRRLQPNLLSRRLGGRFDLRSKPTPEELNLHSDRLCDAFEDWVYRLFGREDALAQQRGNRKLYALISRIRHELKPRLRIVLGQAFGCQPTDRVSDSADDRSFFFSGCYFASGGVQTGKPAFVQGVMRDKLIDEQSQVQWTGTAKQRQRIFRSAVIAGWFAAVLLAVLLVAKCFLG